MLEIAELNGETSNNSTSLIVATLAINIAKLAAATFVILIIATLLKLIAFAIPIIVAPLKRSTCKAIKGRAASSAS
jgi:hypothetical protein